MKGWHVMRDGDGTTVYFGKHRGARYVGVDLRGWNGWTSRGRMPGGYEFYNPTVCIGRLFTDNAHRRWSCEVLIPAKIVQLWRCRRRAYRHALRNDRADAQAAQQQEGDR
jgi:hypothetical protein